MIKGAKALRTLLEDQLDLNAFVMTTGSEGLHVAVPIRPKKDFDEIHSFTKKVAEHLASQQPDAFTTAVRKEN